MRIVRFVRAHLDSLVAVALAAAYLIEVYAAESVDVGEPIIAGVEAGELVALGSGAVFLLSLAVRTRLPVLPLILAFVPFVLLGRGGFDAIGTLLLGAALAAYSVGAWTGGRSAAIGALGVGALTGLAVLRAPVDPLAASDVAGPVLVLLGAWLLGVLARGFRVRRGDPRVFGGFSWDRAGARAAPDSAGRDEVVRELRDVIERAMSAIVLGARDARRSMHDDPRAVERSLAAVEAAGTEALEETQRLTGLLLSPDGTPLPEAQPGLADVEYLAEEVSKAGLPVDTRVEGRPLPLTPDLDAVAYRVVHEALMATLHGSTEAQSRVVIRYGADELQLEIADNGLAAEDADPAGETAGLLAVRKEVAELGGTLDAGPGDERGYWVLARLPYEPDWS